MVYAFVLALIVFMLLECVSVVIIVGRKTIFHPTTMNTDTIPETLNGPIEVGLAAASGDGADTATTLHIYPKASHTLRMLPPFPRLSPVWILIYRCCAALVVRNQWWAYCDYVDANVKQEEIDVHADILLTGTGPADGDLAAMYTAMTPAVIANATLLMAATKVNWWTINHHVGQGECVGFTAKAIRVIGGLGPDVAIPADLRSMAHAVGHWVSTKHALRGWAIQGFDDSAGTSVRAQRVATAAAFPRATKDIMMRLKSGPAGTAQFYTSRAITKFAASSVFSVAMPADSAYAAMLDAGGECLDARFHEGALYLTGNPKEPTMQVEEHTLRALSAFIHAVQPTSKLAKAKVILTASEVAGEDVYTRIVGLVASVRTTRAPKELIATVKLMLGTNVAGDPFAAARASMQLGERKVPTRAELEAASTDAGPPRPDEEGEASSGGGGGDGGGASI